MYVYIYSKVGGCYTVGFYRPDGEWEPESDHATAEEAARRVHYLNGTGLSRGGQMHREETDNTRGF